MIVNFARFQKLLFFLLLFLVIDFGCKSYNIRPNITPEERIELARLMFKKGDYLDAKSQFRILTLNNPGRQFIDEAQFFLAESHFKLKEYILASDEYTRLTRLYPKSQWVDDAYFKIAMCSYKLSPKSSLDQKYTILAVHAFQRFLEDYQDSDLVPEAEKRLKICRTKLAEKEFKAAELYRKLDNDYAALVYFNSVLDSYYDTEFAKDALYWKGESLYALERKSEALAAFQQLLAKYPKSKYTEKARKRLTDLESQLKNAREANGVSTNQTKN